MDAVLRVILIESDSRWLRTLDKVCKEAGWKPKSYGSLDELVYCEECSRANLLIFSVPDHWNDSNCEVESAHLKSWHEGNPRTQLILTLPQGFRAGDRLALNLGARHIFYKPIMPIDISKVLSKAAEEIGKRTRMDVLKDRLKIPQGFEEIIGGSEKIREVIDLAQRVAASDCTSVMITGECGTGKGALAKGIHLASPRSSGPFIEINCAAIPRNLLESEFFGHEKGAFTDAKEEKIGLFECANGGTVFLDEVGEVDFSLQAKLLKFLDTRTIRRISGIRFLPVDVRIISATNKNLKLEVEQKRFRNDLFYRLNVVEISIPPLRERPEDIRPIAEEYTKRFASRLKKRKTVLTDESIRKLERYSWPGNIRELINLIERAVLLNNTGTITPDDLPLEKEQRETIVHIKEEQGRIKVDLPPEGASLEGVERGLIEAALNRADGNTAQAARLLKVGRGTLRYKMKKYGIDPSEIKKNNKCGKYKPVCVTD